MYAIGVDIGGTKVAAGVVGDDGTVVERVRRETPEGDPLPAVVEAVEELRASYQVSKVGVGAAGWVDAARRTVLFAPNLAWRDEPLYDRLREAVGLDVVIENDANAAAWAEYRFGAGRGYDDVVLVTVGTGIGTGFVLGGRLYRGAHGLAAEAGHLHVVPEGHACGCGNAGCWEQYASGTALERLYGASGDQVTAAAREGEPRAVAALGEVGKWLGRGLADLAALLDPARFVVGGGVADAGDLLLEPARRAYASTLSGRGHRPLAEVVRAELGNDAGLVGAADLARL